MTPERVCSFFKQRHWPPLFFPFLKGCSTVFLFKSHKTKEASDNRAGWQFLKQRHWPPLFFPFFIGSGTAPF